MLTNTFKKILENMNNPHKFEPYHKAMREPFDYYTLANEMVSGVVDNDKSELLGLEQLERIQQQVANGDNVVLFANHQSEADPQIYSCLLDPLYPAPSKEEASFAESTIFVAGDRVTTDLLAGPYSMGRNLLCIFSKKHIENPPELKAEKSRHNRNVMKSMQRLFTEGGKIIWVAPSGGRDREDPDGEGYRVAPFDPKSVEMFRLIGDKAKRPTHFYPLSMFTYPICPPPKAVGGAVGEERVVKWSPGGLHFGDEIDLDDFAAGCVVENFPEGCDDKESRDVLRDALAEHIHGIVSDNYKNLEAKLTPLIPE